MAQLITVDDPGDERLDDYRHLRDREAVAAGAVVVEGVFAIRTLAASGRAVRSLLLSPSRAEALAAEVAGLDAPVYVASRAVLAAVAGFDVHRGALASAERWPLPSLNEVVAQARRVLVVEAVNDVENLGALFRTAAAFGVDGVVLCPRCADPLGRRPVRVSLGQVLRVPFTRAERWPDASLDELRRHGLEVVAMALGDGAAPLRHAGLDRVARLAVMVGAEGPGLSPAARAGADRLVCVPMAEGVDSLNVATASALAWYAAGP